ncbi:MAG TPA: class I SAM-dependent methyltransferase [Candidatus Acidoferrales bacterium]|nr:class I SAM-dependent methyltransferase [Candidatus Acidoferrales bacterium]
MESAELIAILNEVRDRVRARYPEKRAGAVEVALPDLTPLVHARDAALGKVAAIGTVNPRPGGVINGLVQAWKRLVARVLDWHVREQVEFNRKTIACVDAAIESFNDFNRALVALGNRIGEIGGELSVDRDRLREELNESKDIRAHWAAWRVEWEQKLAQNEVQFLRSVADLHAGFQHRADLMEANYREQVRGQHRDFEGALERFSGEIQKRLWTDLERIRLEYERLIYAELKTIRQRAQAAAPASQAPAGSQAVKPALPEFDYGHFAERFRGTEEYVRAGQQIYRPVFVGCTDVLDIGCGRGEFLELMREAGVPAKGIDLGEESVAICRAKGLEAEVADLFVYLENLPEASLDGVFCSQVVEHLEPERLPAMVRLAASRLRRGGVIAIETPNPECLAIFATHFYLDPTHQRPVPHPLLVFYLEEYGVGQLEVRKLSPAIESMPSLRSLPEDFREAFFGGLDYAVVGKKL